jgi:hypothetical protein
MNLRVSDALGYEAFLRLSEPPLDYPHHNFRLPSFLTKAKNRQTIETEVETLLRASIT